LTVDEFLSRIIGVYVPPQATKVASEAERLRVFPLVVENEMRSWLRAYRGDLMELYKEVRRSVNRSFKRPPDIEDLERAAKVARQAWLPEHRPPALPEPVDEKTREDGAALLGSVLSAMREDRDPRDDEVVRSILRQYGLDK